MFWKIVEGLVRLVYFKRFRQADRIAQAVKLASDGAADKALALLNQMEPTLHPSLTSIHALSRSRILASLERLDEAEEILKATVTADPGNDAAQLDLALLEGRRFRFQDARDRLKKLASAENPDIRDQARDILALAEAVISGDRQREFERRALAFAAKPIGPNGETPGMPVNVALLDAWIASQGDNARPFADEIALLLGQADVRATNGQWQVALGIEDTVIQRPDGTVFRPFKVVAHRFSHSDTTIEEILQEPTQ
ncbi:MAG: hypothetical protein QNJ97_02480 [Myxococcota bacterium]|nr:hypothetical protein [Myxococcota bacterium]